MAIRDTISVMPDLIRHPVFLWIPAFAGMTIFGVFSWQSNNILYHYSITPILQHSELEDPLKDYPSFGL